MHADQCKVYKIGIEYAGKDYYIIIKENFLFEKI
jgi:hypothetical protein